MKPELYHAHHTSYFEDLPYWISLADQANGPILELGCGTGRILQPLSQEGFKVYGLDHDLRMLRYLKQQIPEAPILAADLTSFHLGVQFSLILLTCNTYSTLSATQRQAALKCIDQHLLGGGLFATSLPNPYDLIEMGDSEEGGPEETFFHPETGNPIQVSSSWQTRQNQVTIDWHYDQLHSDGQVNRTTHSTRHFLDPADSYIQEMKNQGFTVLTDGDFIGNPFSEETDFLILRGYKSSHFSGD
jgi:SAM-dependent methyltransferase